MHVSLLSAEADQRRILMFLSVTCGLQVDLQLVMYDYVILHLYFKITIQKIKNRKRKENPFKWPCVSYFICPAS
jgi:hypothetical protein